MRIYGHNTGLILQLAEQLRDVDVGLRWGGPQVAGAINGDVHLMDGLEQLQVLQTKRIKVPEFIVRFPTQPGEDWLGRRRHHTQGRDIIPVGSRIRGRRNWQNSDYFVRYIPNVVREWRFHILKGASIARGLKYYIGLRNNAGPIPEPEHPIIRSRRLGWHLRHDIDPPKALREQAKAAVEAVGYDLGAVDILELEDGTGCVLEVNSRPAIRDEYTIDKYASALRALAKG